MQVSYEKAKTHVVALNSTGVLVQSAGALHSDKKQMQLA